VPQQAAARLHQQEQLKELTDQTIIRVEVDEEGSTDMGVAMIGPATMKRTATKSFVGEEKDLGDDVYEYTDGNAACDQYMKTTEKIERFVTVKYGREVGRSIADEVLFVIKAPDPPADPKNEIEMAAYKMRMGAVVKREYELVSNMEAVYALIKGQCSQPILEKVKAQAGYAKVHSNRDPIGLLALVKGVMYNYNSKKYRAWSLIEMLESVPQQTNKMTDSEYLEKFRTHMDVVKSAGGDICGHPGMIEDELKRARASDPPSDAQIKSADAAAQERYEATLFLYKSNRSKYGPLLEELSNAYNKERDEYPATVTAAYDMMLHDH
jgi:hypothetical protein